MKRMTLVLLGCLWGLSVLAVTNTNVIVFAQVIVAPEKYKNKAVVYVEEYRSFLTAFPSYIEASGFKTEKWFLLEIGDPRLPVMYRKKTDTITIIANFKPGSRVRVEGRIKEYRLNSRAGVMPNYYVEADAITLVAEPAPGAGMMQRDRDNDPRRIHRPNQFMPQQR